MSKQTNGFTLIELVVAIMVIAIIATIVAPNLIRRRPAYERQEFFDKLTGLVALAYLEGSRTGKIHRIFIDLTQKKVRLEHETEKKRARETVYEPVKYSYLTTEFAWPENLEIKNFYIKQRDEMATAGSVTNTVWFYVTPDGVAQEVTINILDNRDLDEQGRATPVSLVLNPFTLRFTIYNEFQRP